jgi:hypothetical protein
MDAHLRPPISASFQVIVMQNGSMGGPDSSFAARPSMIA